MYLYFLIEVEKLWKANNSCVAFVKLKSQIHKLIIFWIEIDQSQQKGQFLENSYSGL